MKIGQDDTAIQALYEQLKKVPKSTHLKSLSFYERIVCKQIIEHKEYIYVPDTKYIDAIKNKIGQPFQKQPNGPFAAICSVWKAVINRIWDISSSSLFNKIEKEISAAQVKERSSEIQTEAAPRANEKTAAKEKEILSKIIPKPEFSEFAKSLSGLIHLTDTKEAISFLNHTRQKVLDLCAGIPITDMDLITTVLEEAIKQANDPKLLNPNLLERLNELDESIFAQTSLPNATDEEMLESGQALSTLRTLAGLISLYSK